MQHVRLQSRIQRITFGTQASITTKLLLLLLLLRMNVIATLWSIDFKAATTIYRPSMLKQGLARALYKYMNTGVWKISD